MGMGLAKGIRIVEELDGDYVMGEYPSHPGELIKLYAPGNSLGKKPLTAAEAAPWLRKARTATAIRTTARAKELGRLGGKAKYENRKERVADSYAHVLGNTHPDSQTEEQGLAMLAEAAFVQGSDPDGGGAAVKAREQFIQEYTGGKQQEKQTIDARQIHITISPGVELEQRQLVRALEVVDVEARVVEDVDDE